MSGHLGGWNSYITTPETAKHRFFVFLDESILPDNALVNIAHDDAYCLGVLSSNIHVTWALAAGGRLWIGNDPRYNKTRCFETFPFPACTTEQQAKIRALGEQLDAHRKRQQAMHPELTMTGMYNVLVRVRELERGGGQGTNAVSGLDDRLPRAQKVKAASVLDDRSPRTPLASSRLDAKEKKIDEQGLVGILKQLHDELDAAVAEAYGWVLGSARTDSPLSTDDILARLVALNTERAAEEAKGLVRWLRPEYQNAGAGAGAKGKQTAMEVQDDSLAPAPALDLIAWPAELPAQAAALTEVLALLNAPADLEAIAAHFQGKRTKKRLEEMTRLLETLAAVGRARNMGRLWSGT